jgi:hypothetical protein
MPGLDELYKSLHVGAENELAGTTLMLWDNTSTSSLNFHTVWKRPPRSLDRCEYSAHQPAA